MRVGPSSPSPMTSTRPGASARAYSSFKMTCSVDGRPPAAALDGPAQTGPTPVGEHLLPATPDLEARRLVARATPTTKSRELPHQVLVEKGADLPAERHVLGAVSQIHRPGSVAKRRTSI